LPLIARSHNVEWRANRRQRLAAGPRSISTSIGPARDNTCRDGLGFSSNFDHSAVLCSTAASDARSGRRVTQGRLLPDAADRWPTTPGRERLTGFGHLQSSIFTATRTFRRPLLLGNSHCHIADLIATSANSSKKRAPSGVVRARSWPNASASTVISRNSSSERTSARSGSS
jgi:hypothetical protein